MFLMLEYRRFERSPMATRRGFEKRLNVSKVRHVKIIGKLFAKFNRTGSVDDNVLRNFGPEQIVVTPGNVMKCSGI